MERLVDEAMAKLVVEAAERLVDEVMEKLLELTVVSGLVWAVFAWEDVGESEALVDDLVEEVMVELLHPHPRRLREQA